MDKSPPANAGGTCSIPVQGTGIPRASGQPGPCSSTIESPSASTKTQHNQKKKKNRWNLPSLEEGKETWSRL